MIHAIAYGRFNVALAKSQVTLKILVFAITCLHDIENDNKAHIT